MEADFQQFYGLDLEKMGDEYSIRHAAVLAANLPSQSRCMVAYNAALAWSNEMQMLAVIEYDVRTLMWTLLSPKGRPAQPEPIRPPSSKDRDMKQRLESTDINEIDQILHISR